MLKYLMKKFIAALLLLGMLFYLNISRSFANTTEQFIYFYGEGCSHCAKVDKFLSGGNYYQKYQIEKKEIYFNRNNAMDLNLLFEKYNIPIEKRGVPTLFTKDNFLIGDQNIIDFFNKDNDSQKVTFSPPNSSSNLTIPLVIGASLVDSINPCAFAVLLILLSTMTIVKKDKTALKGGLAFSLAVFISYLLMGLGVYKVLSTAHFSLIIIKIIGGMAILLGLWNLKDFLSYDKFLPPIEVPMSWRPKMKSLLRKTTSPTGAFFVGILISLFLLPCTSGPYIVILSMLSQRETFISALSYLILYNLIFILPMLLITFLVYKGLSPEKAELVRVVNTKKLHLIAGILMILVGAYILLFY
ncbi:MAG: Cytochrome c biogenesis protein [Candidatus Levybacteria bacterium GW2011_GWA2_40_8]|nr:MAG: Cytochrome c biogenesis protein [Candidatus Levybacteria bacterium GW2011_GWA2_40_8]